MRVVPIVLLTSAKGNDRFVIGRAMANILSSALVQFGDALGSDHWPECGEPN
jgi:hypothetical protein